MPANITGIPEPSWPTIGNPIDAAAPTPPSPWTSNTAGFYYVATGGTNVGNGYPGDPRGTMPSTLAAGSVVFTGANYAGDHSGGLTCNGTAGSPVWILPYTGRTAATGRWQLAGSYAFVEGIDWTWTFPGKLVISAGASYICVRDCSGTGYGSVDGTSSDPSVNQNTVQLDAPASWAGATEQIVFSGCTFTLGGDWLFASGDPDASGIILTRFTRDVWILDCEFSYMSGCAVIVGGLLDDADIPQRIYVGRNVGHHIAQGAFWTKRADIVIFSENVAHTIRRDCPSAPDAGGIGGQYGPKNVWFINNTVYNAQSGLQLNANSLDPGNTTTNVWVIGNVFYDIHDTEGTGGSWRTNRFQQGGCAISIWGSTGAWVINNTIDDYDVGVICPSAINVNVVGNIFSDRNEVVSGGQVILDTDPGGTNELSNNIYTGSCYVREDTGVVWTDVASITKGVLNISTAPDYADAPARNYELLVGSAGINQSVDHPVYALYLADYGLPITADMDGTSRPQNGGWDMGALETPAGSETLNITTLNATTLTVG